MEIMKYGRNLIMEHKGYEIEFSEDLQEFIVYKAADKKKTILFQDRLGKKCYDWVNDQEPE